MIGCVALSRDNLTKCTTDDAKAARAEVNHEVINNYFDAKMQWNAKKMVGLIQEHLKSGFFSSFCLPLKIKMGELS